jgi:hypothetical protein
MESRGRIGYFGFPKYLGEGRKAKFNALAQNTGNLLFDNALKKLHDFEMVSFSTKDMERFDAFVTTSFIWICENRDNPYHERLLSFVGDKPLVPMSVGLQCDKFKKEFVIHKNTLKSLSAMAERATLGVRGEYTAEILNGYGIRNLQIIGCPSMFYDAPSVAAVNNCSNPRKVCANYNAFGCNLSQIGQDFAEYIAANDCWFVEQNETTFSPEMSVPESREFLRRYFEDKTRVFFDAGEWINFMWMFDFNIGFRFHGNVAALSAGTPALFITSDSRTREMTEYFRLPSIPRESFDKNLPMAHYAALADYTDFRKSYPQRVKNYIEFCDKNGLGTNLRAIPEGDEIALLPEPCQSVLRKCARALMNWRKRP